MSTAVDSVDSLQAFVEKYEAKDYREATQLYHTTPVLSEMARALSHFAHVVSALLIAEDVDAKEIANLTRVLATTLYLIGYRAGKGAVDAS